MMADSKGHLRRDKPSSGPKPAGDGVKRTISVEAARAILEKEAMAAAIEAMRRPVLPQQRVSLPPEAFDRTAPRKIPAPHLRAREFRAVTERDLEAPIPPAPAPRAGREFDADDIRSWTEYLVEDLGAAGDAETRPAA